jgi:radical SAM protein with 4Fe4S-binding SPASM domain
MRASYLAYLLKRFREGDSLVFFKVPFKFMGLSLSRALNRPLAGPLHGSIIATYRCNLKCKMCDLWKRPSEYSEKGKKELSTEEMKKLISDYADIGTSGIGFTGGEPILRSDMLDLITYTKKKGMIAHMSTNGYLINHDMAKKIIDSGLDAIGFSLDGITAETHDRIRGVNGSFDRVIKGLNTMIELKRKYNSGIVILVVCVISRNNIDEIIPMVDMLKKMGVDKISFMPFHDIGLLTNNKETMSELKIDKNEIEKIRNITKDLIRISKKEKIIDSSTRYLSLFPMCFQNTPSPLKCYAGYVSFSVDGYGDMYPCFPFMEMGLSKETKNIRDMSLKEYWYSKELNEIRKRIKNCKKCYWNNQTELNLIFNLTTREAIK